MTENISRAPMASESPRKRRPDGPPAGILAIVALVLSLCAVVVPLLVSGQGYPAPGSSASAIHDYFSGHASAATLGGFFTFAASVPLGIFAATVYARLLKLGVRVPGPNIAFFGGLSASIFLGVAGLLTWTLGQAAAAVSAPVVRLVSEFVFALGGVGFVGGVGLLVAGVAVPALILRLVRAGLPGSAWSSRRSVSCRFSRFSGRDSICCCQSDGSAVSPGSSPSGSCCRRPGTRGTLETAKKYASGQRVRTSLSLNAEIVLLTS